MVTTALITVITEELLERWFGNQLKRGLIAYGGGPPEGSRLWERVYWKYERKPRLLGALLQAPLPIWCAVTITVIIPFEWWQTEFISLLVFYTLLAILFFWHCWARALKDHGRIHSQVEYLRVKGELERSEETL